MSDNRPKAPDTVFHYTSLDAFLGITGFDSINGHPEDKPLSGRMRLSSLPFLNDDSEFVRTIGWVRQLLSEEDTAIPSWAMPPKQRDDDYLVKLRYWMEQHLNSMTYPFRIEGHSFEAHGEAHEVIPEDRDEPASIGVACFSALEQNLSMYRMYCPATGGVAIGFDSAVLANLGHASPYAAQAIQWSPCHYIDDQRNHLANHFRQLIKTLIQEADPVFENIVAGDFTAAQNSFPKLDRVLGDLRGMAAHVKDHAFKVEGEWRLSGAFSQVEGWQGVARNGYIQTFQEIEIPLSAIRCVDIGPGTYPQRAQRSVDFVRRCLARFGANFDVRLSNISLVPH